MVEDINVITGRKCAECYYWENEDDPHEACKNDFCSDPNDGACSCFSQKGDE